MDSPIDFFDNILFLCIISFLKNMKISGESWPPESVAEWHAAETPTHENNIQVQPRGTSGHRLHGFLRGSCEESLGIVEWFRGLAWPGLA